MRLRGVLAKDGTVRLLEPLPSTAREGVEVSVIVPEVSRHIEVSEGELARRAALVARLMSSPRTLRAPPGQTSVDLVREDRDSH